LFTKFLVFDIPFSNVLLTASDALVNVAPMDLAIPFKGLRPLDWLCSVKEIL